MLIEELRPSHPGKQLKYIKLEAKYFIIISAGFIDRRELLQISSCACRACRDGEN